MIEVRMTKARETKNTVRFESFDEGSAIDTLYIQKSALKDLQTIDTIVVTVKGSHEEV